MSNSTKRDFSGALFKAKPSDNPKWPQYEGSCLIDGQEYWLSAWVKEGNAGKFFSLAFKPKVARQDGAKPVQRAASTAADDSDLIPF
jgi:hypothetical protein